MPKNGIFSVPPRMLIDNTLHAVSLAEEVMMHCDVLGDPSDITWTKNGELLELGHRIRQMYNGTLFIYGSTVRLICGCMVVRQSR